MRGPLFIIVVTSAALPLSARAQDPTIAAGLTKVWSDDFCGSAGDGVDTNEWQYITNLNVNNEVQTYTEDRRNLQLSGACTLQIVPWRESDRWTSGRIEGIRAFTPVDGGVTVIHAEIRFGCDDPSRKQGIWPAFWLLGESIRQGVEWPMCGEIDILETINGESEATGTVHCDKLGGVCDTPVGIQGRTSLPDNKWHTWSLWNDRTGGEWQRQTMTWCKDGAQFHQVTGGRIGNKDIWASLAHSPMYIILNVAVGGNYPGDPNDDTVGGYASMMEVRHVAVYQ